MAYTHFLLDDVVLCDTRQVSELILTDDMHNVSCDTCVTKAEINIRMLRSLILIDAVRRHLPTLDLEGRLELYGDYADSVR